MGIRGPRTKIIDESHLSCGQGTTTYLDICGRICQCRLCSSPIKSGETRFCVASRVGRQMPNGGYIAVNKHFFHPKCFSDYILQFTEVEFEHPVRGPAGLVRVPRLIQGLPREEGRFCVDCDVTTVAGQRVNAYLSARHPMQALCRNCAGQDKWMYCDHCGSYVKKYAISDAILPDRNGKILGVCDRCAEVGQVLTVKKENRRKREAEKIAKQFEDVKNFLEERYAH